MSEQTQQALSEAFDLIEADKLAEARTILTPMLTTHRDNPDVWWLYAHAVADADTARMALYNVMRLDPNYPNAPQLLEQLEKQADAPRDRVMVAQTEQAFLTDIPPTLPDLPDDDEREFEDIDLDLEEKPVSESASRSRLLLLAVLGILAVLIIVAIAVITSQPRGPAIPTPTSEVISGVPSATPLAVLPAITDEPTPELEVTPEITATATLEVTEEVTAEVSPTVSPTETEVAASLTAESDATVEATEQSVPAEPSPTTTTANEAPEATAAAETSPADTFEVFSQALSDYTLAADEIGTEQTELGNTLVANVCTDAGLELRSTLPAVMDVIAQQPITMPVDAVGVRLTDCGDSTTLRLIVVPFADAQSYAAGDLSEEEFQARWKSL